MLLQIESSTSDPLFVLILTSYGDTGGPIGEVKLTVLVGNRCTCDAAVLHSGFSVTVLIFPELERASSIVVEGIQNESSILLINAEICATIRLETRVLRADGTGTSSAAVRVDLEGVCHDTERQAGASEEAVQRGNLEACQYSMLYPDFERGAEIMA
jgi:hypothetical protein